MSYASTPQLVVRSAASGDVVQKLLLGHFSLVNATIIVDGLPCRLPPGEYEVTVAGRTTDAAGNPVVEAVCARALRVK